MRENINIDRYSLVVQIVLSFLALILLTTTAVGLPAVWLIHSQAERQTWARLNQGSQTTATDPCGETSTIDLELQSIFD